MIDWQWQCTRKGGGSRAPLMIKEGPGALFLPAPDLCATTSAWGCLQYINTASKTGTCAGMRVCACVEAWSVHAARGMLWLMQYVLSMASSLSCACGVWSFQCWRGVGPCSSAAGV